MNPHPMYWELSVDELLQGEEVTDADFYERYQTEAVRSRNSQPLNFQTKARSTFPSTFALAGIGRAASKNTDDAEEGWPGLRLGS